MPSPDPRPCVDDGDHVVGLHQCVHVLDRHARVTLSSKYTNLSGWPLIPPDALTVSIQALYGSNWPGLVRSGPVHWQIPPITIGDPVGAAAAEPVDCWLVDWLADVLPDVVGLLDDDLLLDEQATDESAAPRTQSTRFN